VYKEEKNKEGVKYIGRKLNSSWAVFFSHIDMTVKKPTHPLS